MGENNTKAVILREAFKFGIKLNDEKDMDYDWDKLNNDKWLLNILAYNDDNIEETLHDMKYALNERYINGIHKWNDKTLNDIFQMNDEDEIIYLKGFDKDGYHVLHIKVESIPKGDFYHTILKTFEKLERDEHKRITVLIKIYNLSNTSSYSTMLIHAFDVFHGFINQLLLIWYQHPTSKKIKNPTDLLRSLFEDFNTVIANKSEIHDHVFANPPVKTL